MIKISNLICKFTEEEILNIPDFSIESNGLYIILGPSGCGKTTLLNIIAGLESNYLGRVEVLGRSYASMGEQDNVKFRAKNISVCFQHNVFLQEISLLDNIKFARDNIENNLNTTKNNSISKLSSKLGITSILDKKCKILSGGEKTRGAIARTLSKEVPIYLFDEPTAALDSINSEKVMDIIKEKSRNSIIILVTHDRELAHKYADELLEMEYGKFVNREFLNYNRKVSKVSNFSEKAYNRNTKYIAKSLLKTKKLRHIITGGSINLGLLGVGLSLLIVSAVNGKLVNEFSGQFDEETVYVESKKATKINAINAPLNEEIALDFGGDVITGSVYVNNFDEMFPDENKLIFSHNNKSFVVPSFHFGLYNEAMFLDEIIKEVEPKVNRLEPDEIGLVLPYDDFKLFQNVYGLPFKNTVDDFAYYLSKNDIVLTFDLANNSWDYFDQFSFILKTVTLGENARIIVNDPSVIKDFFENKIPFPISQSLLKLEEYPWTLKEVKYLYVKNREDYLWNKEYYRKYVLFTANSEYFTYLNDPMALERRIIVFSKPPVFNEAMHIDEDEINKLFYTFNNGLNFIPQLMLVGFQNNFFVSDSPEKIEEVIKADKEITDKLNPDIIMEKNIMNLSFQYNSFGSFNFKNIQDKLSIKQIIVSSGLALKLFETTDVINQELYVGCLTEISELDSVYFKEYQRATLTIVDVIEEDDLVFYHQPIWTYLLFKDVFYLSPFDHEIKGTVFETFNNNLVINENLYNVHFPFKEFKESINASLQDLEKYTLVISFGAFILSGLISFVVIYLLVEETNEQFSCLYLLGYSRNNIQNIVTKYIWYFISAFIGFSLIQLFGFSFLIEFILMDFFGGKFAYSFNVIPYVFVILLAVILLTILLWVFERRMAKIDLLQFTKKDL